ncbi:hypothetical protein GG851_18065 [Bordetella petrii]|nr:hypothetical protein [Bordetella petrii]
MLFLVISNPRPESPSTVKSNRQAYWKWIQPLLESKQALSVHARVGRGGVVLFDVDSNMTLHRLVSEWSEIVPAQFDIYPLVDSNSAQDYLKVHAQSGSGAG